MQTPAQIIMGGQQGRHNGDPGAVIRVQASRAHRDLSTVCVICSVRGIQPRVVDSWWELMTPMNQRFQRLFVTGLDVAEAYNTGVSMILEHPILSTYRYLLTLECDNLPPPRGLLMLLEQIEGFAAVGGLYWTKGEGGKPMIFGHPKSGPRFAPQVPEPDTLQECNALGMGFTLFDLGVFRDPAVPRPWFRSAQRHFPEYGPSRMTQDIHFFAHLRDAGYRVACDTRVRVGHLDEATGIVW